MTIQDLGSLGELIGSVAVLATLVYLTLQMRQNTQAIQGQLDATYSATRQNSALSVATSTELAEVLREDNTADVTADRIRLSAFWMSAFFDFEWSLLQARRGLLPSFNEAAMAATVRTFSATYRSFEGWWEGFKSNYSPDFVEWVEEQRQRAA